MQADVEGKYSSFVLNTYTFIAKKVAIFAQKNSKISSLMFLKGQVCRKH